MESLFNNFSGNKKQKTAWVIYVIVSTIVFIGISISNSENYSCYSDGHCAKAFETVIVLGIIFAVVALLFRSAKK